MASGFLFTAVLFLWPVLMIVFKIPEDPEKHFLWIQDHTSAFKIQFFFAFLISPSILYLMYTQLDKYPAIKMLRLIPGTIFLAGYFVLSSISYGSQMIILPKLIRHAPYDQTMLWYFNSHGSITYFLNQMGYCFWGLGALVLFWPLIRKRGMIQFISILYVISALLSIVAFAGLILDNERINSMTLYSGLFLIPVGILSVIWGVREKGW